MKPRLPEWLLGLALMAVLGWPTLATVVEAWHASATWSAADTGGVARPLRLAGETLRLVLAVEAIALPIGIVLALVLFRTNAWGRGAVLGLLLLVALVPLPLHSTAWLGALGNVGRAQAFGSSPLLVGWTGAAIIHALAVLPWVAVLTGVGLRSVEPELEEAALLDWPAWRVVTQITRRRALGALAGAALAVAVLTAGDMTVTDLLEVRSYAEEAYLQYALGNGPGSAAVVALPPLIVLGVLVVLVARGLLRADPATLASASTRGRVWRLGVWRVPLGLTVVLLAGNLAAVPLYSLLWRAGRVGGSALLGKPPRWSPSGLAGSLASAASDVAWPLVETLAWSALGALMTVALAWPLAWVSRPPSPWRWVTALAVALMLATPGPVAGMALVFAYRSLPIVYDTAAILILADVFRTLPFALLILWPTVRAIPPEFLDAAAVDGCGPWGQMRRVALPISGGALVAAWGVAFVLALGELPATNMVSPPGANPLSRVIWELLHTGVESHLAAVALVMLAAIAVIGVLAAWALDRCGVMEWTTRLS